MKKPITAYILTKLFRAASEDDIIYSVCQRTDLSWEQARTLVEQVKNEHQEEIKASQIPLKSLLAFVFYVVGILLTLGPMVYLWIMLDVTKTLLGFISSGFGDAETALTLFESRCALLGWFELPSIIFTMLLGIGIINVNLRYMRGVWETLFRKWHVIDQKYAMREPMQRNTARHRLVSDARIMLVFAALMYPHFQAEYKSALTKADC